MIPRLGALKKIGPLIKTRNPDHLAELLLFYFFACFVFESKVLPFLKSASDQISMIVVPALFRI